MHHPDPNLDSFLSKLMALEAGRQAYIDKLWASIPSYVQEDAYSGLAGALVINAQPKTGQLYLATLVVVSVPTGSTGTLVLGDCTLPVPAGVTVIPGAAGAFLVSSTAPRQLTITPTGVCSLHIIGQLLPTMGTMH